SLKLSPLGGAFGNGPTCDLVYLASFFSFATPPIPGCPDVYLFQGGLTVLSGGTVSLLANWAVGTKYVLLPTDPCINPPPGPPGVLVSNMQCTALVPQYCVVISENPQPAMGTCNPVFLYTVAGYPITKWNPTVSGCYETGTIEMAFTYP